MHKNFLTKIGVILIIFDIFIYGLLHDCTNLSIFTNFSSFKIFEEYKNVQNQFAAKYSSLFIFRFSKNYLVDLIWYISFLLIVFNSIKTKSKYFIILSIGITSELTQLLFPILGTFDYVDLTVYFMITIVAYLYEKRIENKINTGQLRK